MWTDAVERDSIAVRIELYTVTLASDERSFYLAVSFDSVPSLPLSPFLPFSSFILLFPSGISAIASLLNSLHL